MLLISIVYNVDRNLAGISMHIFNHRCDSKYYENLTNWLSTLRIGETPAILQ